MTLRILHFPFAYRYVRASETVLAERKAKDMALRHRIRINVSDEKSKARVLEGADRRLPTRLLRFLFGDFTTVYLLSPGQSVESVEIHEVKGGGKINEQSKTVVGRN